MLIQTTRFGTVEVDDLKIINFADGLLGFPRQRRFALIQPAPDAAFYWLQSVEDPGLAFVVADPQQFVPDYEVPLRPEDAAAIGVAATDDFQVLGIVNKVDQTLTMNLLGPIVIGPRTFEARQVVLSDKRYTTRQPILQLATARPAAVARTA